MRRIFRNEAFSETRDEEHFLIQKGRKNVDTERYRQGFQGGLRRRSRGEEEEPADRYRMLRQWLNILFMIGAVVGVVLYLKYGDVGTYVILAAMILKIVECVLRLMK